MSGLDLNLLEQRKVSRSAVFLHYDEQLGFAPADGESCRNPASRVGEKYQLDLGHRDTGIVDIRA